MILEDFLKGGSRSGNWGHAGRKGKRGGSAKRSGVIGTSLSKSSSKVWTGEQVEFSGSKPSKLEVGAKGEEVAISVLSQLYGTEFDTLNKGLNNSPIDVGGDHAAVEVKTGLATNGKTAQHWRASIGEPGKTEKELLKQMSKEEKREYNQFKSQKILERKQQLLDKLSEEVGAEVKPTTIGIIMHPDLTKADVYSIPGFHLRLPWKSYATDEYYLGSYVIG